MHRMTLVLVLALGIAAPAEARKQPTVDSPLGCFAADDSDVGCGGAICYCCWDDGCWICESAGYNCVWDPSYRAATNRNGTLTIGPTRGPKVTLRAGNLPRNFTPLPRSLPPTVRPPSR
jgi:hypothetical protein